MTPERHRRAKEIFLRACALEPAERAAAVERECDGDAELRDHVVALLGLYRGPAIRVEEPEPVGRLARGQVVDGKFVVEARLGAGGMGEVYRARQLALDRDVVLKVLTCEPLPDALRRFEREARALARLRDPHVVTVHDLGVADEVGHYLVMEYFEGRTLRDEVRRRGALPVDEAVELMRQVCAGTAAAHAAGVIHRDLKPANVLLQGEGDSVTAKVADFGIARLAEPSGTGDDGLTGTGTVMGTANYMSPEQSRGEEADERSDVYALGCVFYELVAGRPPFEADSVLGLLEKHRSESPADLTGLRPDVSEALAHVVARALEKERERRWPSAAALGDALAGVTRGEPFVEAAASATPNNVPRPLTRCLGREREFADLTAMLLDEWTRLVTITGTGGIGKTRLAVEAAHALAPSFPDGVYEVTLASLSDPALLAQRIARALGVRESADGPVDELLAGLLRGKRSLLVLDNFEHVLDAAPLVARLLEAAPRVKALVTSQAPLHLRGEHEYALDALALPALGATLEELERSPAAALFAERAREVKPSFAITAENARAVAEVCRRVDGLPLAIELAAARVKVLSPEAIAARLEHRLALLTGGARDLPERQRTMRATVTWSYDLLGEREKALLRALAVFTGGCTPDAAEAVSDGAATDVGDALDSLTDKSLLRRSEEDGETRFGMLEVVRELALERLEAEGEADDARMRHARYFLGLTREADPNKSPDDGSWIARFGREHENCSSALGVLLEREPREGVRMAVAFRRYWPLLNLFSDGIKWTRRALASEGAGPAERAALLAGVGLFEGMVGDRDAANEHVREAVATARELGDETVLLDALNCAITNFILQPGTHAEARSYAEEALGLVRKTGNANKTAAILNHLLVVTSLEGDRARARAYGEEALALNPSSVSLAASLLNLGVLALEDGDLVGAEKHLRAGLALVIGYGDRVRAATVFELMAELAFRQGDPARAARLGGAVEVVLETTEGVRSDIPSGSWERARAEARDALGPEAYERERERGRAMGFDAAVDEACRED